MCPLLLVDDTKLLFINCNLDASKTEPFFMHMQIVCINRRFHAAISIGRRPQAARQQQ